jgi:hypothetical protein
VVDITDGNLPDDPVPVLWMPLGPCESVTDDFCVHANLFWGPDHLDAWRHAAGDPPGEVVTLAVSRWATGPVACRRRGWRLAHHRCQPSTTSGKPTSPRSHAHGSNPADR